jgi:hypothetical protein
MHKELGRLFLLCCDFLTRSEFRAAEPPDVAQQVLPACEHDRLRLVAALRQDRLVVRVLQRRLKHRRLLACGDDHLGAQLAAFRIVVRAEFEFFCRLEQKYQPVMLTLVSDRRIVMKLENNVRTDAICLNNDSEARAPDTKSTAGRVETWIKMGLGGGILTIRQSLAVAAIGFWFMMPSSIARADSEDMTDWGAQWEQWAYSIPTAVNPLLGSDNINPALDYSTAGKCVVGQHGSVWFLAGTFFGGTAIRTCSVPEGTSLFFPVVNSVQINTPGVCGQVGNISVSDLRRTAANTLAGATHLVYLDGQAIHNIQHLQSTAFEVALPEDNVFDAPCLTANLGNVPAGIYSPAVDDGFYVRLQPLKTGPHTLRIQATAPGLVLDVTFNLNVVPVSKK